MSGTSNGGAPSSQLVADLSQFKATMKMAALLLSAGRSHEGHLFLKSAAALSSPSASGGVGLGRASGQHAGQLRISSVQGYPGEHCRESQ